jgi:hypothetical protein
MSEIAIYVFQRVRLVLALIWDFQAPTVRHLLIDYS